MKIDQYPEVELLSRDDRFLMDTPNGTRQYKLKQGAFWNLLEASYFADRDILHSANYRCKNLGTFVTDKQWASIKSGSFDDLFVGDYWMINNIQWQIVDINYWAGRALGVADNHLMIMPRRCIATGPVNSTNTNSTGYVGSFLYTDLLPKCLNQVNDIFGEEHIVARSEALYPNAVSDAGLVTSTVWMRNVKIEVPNEPMIFGCRWQALNGGSVGDVNQLALFRFHPYYIVASGYNAWWLRDNIGGSNTSFVCVMGNAGITGAKAGDSHGVRPLFAIKG